MAEEDVMDRTINGCKKITSGLFLHLAGHEMSALLQEVLLKFIVGDVCVL